MNYSNELDKCFDLVGTYCNRADYKIIAFYHKDVFYLDEDGYLDYDFEKEGLIGAAYNPDIEYWME